LVAASDSTAAITPTAVAIIAIPGLARTTKFVLNCRFVCSRKRKRHQQGVGCVYFCCAKARSASLAVPELTRVADIQVNDRV
jgi:hypothetical protein